MPLIFIPEGIKKTIIVQARFVSKMWNVYKTTNLGGNISYRYFMNIHVYTALDILFFFLLDKAPRHMVNGGFTSSCLHVFSCQNLSIAPDYIIKIVVCTNGIPFPITMTLSEPSAFIDSMRFSLESHQNTRSFMWSSMASPVGRPRRVDTSSSRCSPFIQALSIFGKEPLASVQYIQLSKHQTKYF